MTPTHYYDVFNGDADGICALHQLRLVEPRPSVLVTGVKRDIRLLERLTPEPNSHVTVLDVSLESNRTGLLQVLERGCRVRYFDHHNPGEGLTHPGLEAHIDTSAQVCTSILVNRHLGGQHLPWAVAAAFGDNLIEPALRLAEPLHLDSEALEALRTLGELLNYNAYGETVADLHFHPAQLYRSLAPFADPLEWFRGAPEADTLREGFAEDLRQAQEIQPLLDEAAGQVILLPEAPWARRVIGVFANRLAQEHTGKATVLIVEKADGTLTVSVRAPVERPQGADVLCGQFPTGGGRVGAAGINALPAGDLPRFLEAFRKQYF